MLHRFLKNYRDRHLHPVNQVLHAIGVPLTFVVSVIFLVLELPWWALGSFVVGYFLQFAGHAVEGNEAGEVVLVKRWIGLSYREFGPRYRMPVSPKSNREK